MGKFKSFLIESDIKKSKAESLGLVHVSFNNYKNSSGKNFYWDDSKNDFVKKENEQVERLKIGQKVKLVVNKNIEDKEYAKTMADKLQGIDHFKIQEVAVKGIASGKEIGFLKGHDGYLVRGDKNEGGGNTLVQGFWIRSKNDYTFEIKPTNDESESQKKYIESVNKPKMDIKYSVEKDKSENSVTYRTSSKWFKAIKNKKGYTIVMGFSGEQKVPDYRIKMVPDKEYMEIRRTNWFQDKG